MQFRYHRYRARATAPRSTPLSQADNADRSLQTPLTPWLCPHLHAVSKYTAARIPARAKAFHLNGAWRKERAGNHEDVDARACHHRRPDRRTRDQRRRIRRNPEHHGTRADLHGTRHLLCDVERALFLQVVEEMAAHPADRRPASDLRT